LMSQIKNDDLPALRVVHLQGGLRAFDLGDPNVRIGPEFDLHLLTIPKQPYSELYAALQRIGLVPLGVDFISGQGDILGRSAPDFQFFVPNSGFSALWGERAWSDVRNVPEQKTSEIIDLSGRFSTYHRLLNLRIRELSESYRRCLFAQVTDFEGRYKTSTHGTLFSNTFQTYVEAAIHAFLADAAGFRDLIAEAVWKLVLREQSRDVNTLSVLLKRTKQRSDPPPILQSIHEAAGETGWLKVLTGLRNSVTHIAPLANTHEMHETQLRLFRIGEGAVPIMHYPLTTREGSLRLRPEPIDFDGNENDIKARIEAYAAFVEESGDALAYAVETMRCLVRLATEVREVAGLRHQMAVLTGKDIIGPIVFHGRKPPSAPDRATP
jgi:hypothetical protein